MRIAIVNDLRIATEALKRVIEAGGHQLAWTAVDGVEGVDKYRNDKPDLILMDLVMPNMDGAEATRQINQITMHSRVQDIDVLQFYAEHYESFPLFACVVRKILGTNAASTSCERTFNYAGIVLNCRRTSLLTDLADKLIVSACRHKNALRSELKSPMLPNIGEIEIDSTIAEETVEEAEAAEEFWDDFFSEL